MKAIVLAALPLLMTGIWSGYAEYGRDAAHHVPIIRSAKVSAAAPPPHVMDEHGELANLSVELIPDSVIIEGNAETIEYHAEITSQIEQDAAYAWSAVVVDDRGLVVRELASGEGAVEARGVATTPGFVAELADGFYMLRVRAALVAEEFEDISVNATFLRVRDGVMREMSATDWYQTSQATLATQVTEAGAQ